MECVRKYGPYIVIMPKIAMPHSQEGAVGVNKTAIGFMKLEKPVSFDPNDPEKDAAAVLHTGILQPGSASEQYDASLSEMLMNEELVAELLEAKGPEDLLRLQEKYLDNKEG